MTSPAEWNSLLARAIAGEGMQSVFQPIVDLQRCRVVGYEALTRFDLPGAPRVGPDRWFAEAERIGAGPELDARALRIALQHRDSLPPNCFLTLNVDPLHLLEPSVRSVFAEQHDLAGIVIEMTEHRSWNWSDLEGTVDMLRSSGALVAIDDAGAGHSGLQQILHMRPSIVKLDRSIIEGLDRDESKVAMVEMMGVFANRVDAWLLAEGVETAAEARCLFDLGVPLAQGYYFARPMGPWTGVSEDARAALGGRRTAASSTETMDRLLDQIEPLRRDEIRDHDWIASVDRWKPVIDVNERPIGVVDPEAAFDGELLATVVANVDSTPREVAHRVATASSDPSVPVVVIDSLGKYLGIVTMRRLLRHLAGEEH